VDAVTQKRRGERSTSLLDSAATYESRRRARSIIDAYGIEIIALKAAYLANPGKRALILDGSTPCDIEEYVCRHFTRLQYQHLENRPIRLFATFMWPVIQDVRDTMPHRQFPPSSSLLL
jgi:hypothetical protein